jgi:inhibitor of KinA
MKPEGAYDQARLHMAGEALLIVEFGDQLTSHINDAALAFDHYLQDNELDGLLESAPASRSVAVCFDPLIVAPEQFRKNISKLVKSIDWFSGAMNIEPKRWRLPVVYGGEVGPDLEHIAEKMSLSVDEVIEAHFSTIQRVFMIGFAPGFLYTGMLPELFNIPRLPDIKPQVPAGSVSIAIGQTVISSTSHPTGWHVIGRTPFSNFDPERQPPVLISAGDEIEFYQIDQSSFDKWEPEHGEGHL